VAERRFEAEIGGGTVAGRLACLHDGTLLLSVQGGGVAPGDWPAQPLVFLRKGEALEVAYAGWRQTLNVYQKQVTAFVHTAQGAIQMVVKDVYAPAVDGQTEGGRLTAPMPGKVVSVAVKAGDRVAKGQILAVMDAMKMEHAIAAPQDGVVAEVLYAPGDQVAEGAELLKLEVAA
jgi:3-methylcrotonyl-CoA carboxylase alpha subunit